MDQQIEQSLLASLTRSPRIKALFSNATQPQSCFPFLAKQIKQNPDKMKASLYKFKDQFEKMLARDVHFHNLIPSSEERAWANLSNI